MVDFIDDDGGVVHDYVGTDRAEADRIAVGWARDAGCRIVDRSTEEPEPMTDQMRKEVMAELIKAADEEIEAGRWAPDSLRATSFPAGCRTNRRLTKHLAQGRIARGSSAED